MSKLLWDKTGEHFYETGVDHGVLYVMNGAAYGKGVAWNGLVSVTESPEGAELTPIYADNIKYLNLRSNEDFKATIEAYTYPDEFEQCDGSASLGAGVKIGQQKRKSFGFCYRTKLGNDVDADDYGYKIHIIYGASAAPSERAYETINDTPEAITFSWELDTVPVEVTGFKPTAHLEIDSTKCDPAVLAEIEAALYGDDTHDARLLLPDQIAAMISGETLSMYSGATADVPATAEAVKALASADMPASFVTGGEGAHVTITVESGELYHVFAYPKSKGALTDVVQSGQHVLENFTQTEVSVDDEPYYVYRTTLKQGDSGTYDFKL